MKNLESTEGGINNQEDITIEKFEQDNEGLQVMEKKETLEASAEIKEAAAGKHKEGASKEKEPVKPEFKAEAKEEIPQGNEERLKEYVRERKERIISNFAKAIAAAGDDKIKLEQIADRAKMFTKKGYPDICDDIHDKLAERRAERDMKSGGAF